MKGGFKMLLLKDKKKKLFIGIATLLITSILIIIFLFQLNRQKTYTEEEVEEIKEEYPLKIINGEGLFESGALAAVSFYYSKDGREEILYKKNEKEVLPIASISKLMTAQVALSSYNLNDPIMVKESDIVSKTEFRDFRAWEETKIEEIIYQMLIESNNSAAFALAMISDRYIESEKDAVDSFVEEMNKYAKKIGLQNTVFINPSGLDRERTYNSSTGEEIIKFTKYIIRNSPSILDISKMPFYNLYSPDKSIYYTAINTNDFLHIIDEEWQNKIIGGKTGFTSSANGCLLIVLESPEKDGYIINIVLGAKDRFLEMRKLINYVYESYQF